MRATAFSRAVTVEIDWISDSSFEIRGSLTDNVHSLSARLIVSFPDFAIREAGGQIVRMPYPGYCQGSVAVLEKLVGERIGRGFRRRASEIVGSAEGCNHLHTLVFNMAACAFQMNYVAAKRQPESLAALRDAAEDHGRRRELVLGWMPELRNSCYVFSEQNNHLFQIEPYAGDPGDEDGKIL